MLLLPANPAALLAAGTAGFAVGVSVAGGVFLALDYHRRALRRAVLGVSAGRLAEALAEVAEDGDLPYHLMQRVGGLHALAAAVARAVAE